MLHAFAYQRQRHVRACDPRPGNPYTDYRRYKPALQQEFGRRCVYCRRADSPIDPGSFHVDHYKPRQLAPELETEYSNLFYACWACNNSKGTYWDDPDRRGSHCIPNPCDHVMSEHLKYEGGTVVARGTSQGTAAIRVLDLNDPLFVAWRESALRDVARIRQEISTRTRQLKKIRKELKRTNPPSRVLKLLEAGRRIEQQLVDARSDLETHYALPE